VVDGVDDELLSILFDEELICAEFGIDDDGVADLDL
jgi:hypothetical protein